MKDGDDLQALISPSIEDAIWESPNRSPADPIMDLWIEFWVIPNTRQHVVDSGQELQPQPDGALFIPLRRLVEIRLGAGS